MFEEVLSGTAPSSVFRQVLQNNPDLYYRDMAILFYQRFPEIDSGVIQHIWAWEAPGRTRAGLNDDSLDLMITELLREAKYL
jgi:hypothetical protein